MHLRCYWISSNRFGKRIFKVGRVVEKKLDSMRWFSHRRRTGGRHNCITYLLTDVVPYLQCPHSFVDFLRSDSASLHILGCGRGPGMGHMAPNSNSDEIFVQRIYSPIFIILRSIVRKLSCWQTNKLTNKQTPLKTSNTILYATPVGN